MPSTRSLRHSTSAGAVPGVCAGPAHTQVVTRPLCTHFRDTAGALVEGCEVPELEAFAPVVEEVAVLVVEAGTLAVVAVAAEAVVSWTPDALVRIELPPPHAESTTQADATASTSVPGMDLLLSRGGMASPFVAVWSQRPTRRPVPDGSHRHLRNSRRTPCSRDDVVGRNSTRSRRRRSGRLRRPAASGRPPGRTHVPVVTNYRRTGGLGYRVFTGC
jgi:hypothetical protein